MALSDRKITDSQISTNGVVSAPDELKGTIPQNKAIFDKLIKETVKEQLNGLIDDLIATSGAAQIGASAPAGLTGANIQALLNALNTAATTHTGNVSNPHDVTKAQVGLGNVDNTPDTGKPISTAQKAALDLKVDKVAGKGLSTNDYDNTEKTKVAQIDSKANTADVITKTNTTAFTPTVATHPATKGYVDEVALTAGAVSSVFGRAGAVTPQDGDYIASQVNMTGYVKPSAGGHILPADTVAQALGKVDARNLAYYGGSNKNILINPDFQINQRGQTFYSGNGYTVDGWAINADTGGIAEVVDGNVKLSFKTIYGRYSQLVENYQKYAGLTVTYSIKFGTISKNCYIQIADGVNPLLSREITPADSNSIVFITHTISANPTKLEVMVQKRDDTTPTAEAYCVVKAEKLELGSISTLANDPPVNYGEHLALCQRYFQIFKTQALRPTHKEDFRPCMRIDPALGTLTIGGATYYTADANL